MYWIIHGLTEVKYVLINCTICYRFKAETAKELMGILPIERVEIDFGGTVLIKQSHLRKSIKTNGYFALFICMVTKAIHLELVSSLSTEAFLLTLK